VWRGRIALQLHEDLHVRYRLFRWISAAPGLLSLLVAHLLPAQTGRSDIVSGPLGGRADSLLGSLVGKGFSGVVLVAKNGVVILSKGYGLANRATKSPMTSSSVIQIGSNTKDFTAVAVLQLMERGKLSLTDSIGKFLGAAVPSDKRGVTVENLLRHRGGFPQHIGGDWDRVSRDSAIREAMAAPLLFAPGADGQYSNTGYSLLAAIIELVSGTTYDRYVQENILAPIGLHETGLHLPKFAPERAAHGYRDGQDMGTFLQRQAAPDGGPYWHLRGNGGMLSTVGDMYHFYQVLMGDSRPILTPASRNIMFQPDAPSMLAGSDGTYFFLYGREPAEHLEFIIVSNATDYPAPQARQQLMNVLWAGERMVVETGGPGRSGTRMIDTARGSQRAIARPTDPGVVTFPDSPAGRAAREYLRVYNEGDSVQIRRFLESRVVRRPDDTRTIDQRVTAFRAMNQRMGRLTLLSVVPANDNEVAISARSTDGIVSVILTVEAETPNRIIEIRIQQG
jgi:CubicO group peptidase (beta-lactamase class C family)